jgi:hypothetical protein
MVESLPFAVLAGRCRGGCIRMSYGLMRIHGGPGRLPRSVLQSEWAFFFGVLVPLVRRRRPAVVWGRRGLHSALPFSRVEGSAVGSLGSTAVAPLVSAGRIAARRLVRLVLIKCMLSG